MIFRALVAATCVAGIWWSWRIARADYYFRQDTVQSLETAIAWIPDQPRYYARLAQLDPEHAQALLEKTISLNAYDSKAAIDLALLREARGDTSGAEKLLLRAFAADRTYLTRWSLANFYFRRDDVAGFWKWARQAAEMPAEDIAPLFQLAWRVTPDARTIVDKLLTNDPSAIRQLLAFVAGKGALEQAAAMGRQLMDRGQPDWDRAALLSLIDRLIAADDAAAAQSLWRHLAARHWIVADSTLPENRSFARQPLQAGFDWRLSSYDGLRSWPGPSGLEVEFSARQPESCIIAEQVIPLPAGDHEFRYRYRTSGIGPGTGLHWRLMDAAGVTIAASGDLSHETPTDGSVQFKTAPGTALVRLRLEYQRALGTPRVSGSVFLISTSLS